MTLPSAWRELDDEDDEDDDAVDPGGEELVGAEAAHLSELKTTSLQMSSMALSNCSSPK